MVFGKDGRLFILGTGPICSAWNFRQGGLKVLRQGKQDCCTAAILTPNGKSLVAGLKTGRVLLLDLESGQEQTSLQLGPNAPVTALAFSPGSGRPGVSPLLAVGFANQRAQLWNVAQKKVLHTSSTEVESEEAAVRTVCFAPDGRSLLIQLGRRVWLMQTGTDQPVKEFKPSDELLAGVGFSPDGRTLTVPGEEGAVCLYRLEPAEGGLGK